MGFGARPALLIVDVMRAFCGDARKPILESIKEWRNSCGEEAWDAVGHIGRLLDSAHARAIPVIYTTSATLRDDGWDQGRWPDKNSRGREDADQIHVGGNEIIKEIAPAPYDIVLCKYKPSAFYGTILDSHLVDLNVDSLIVAGTTTSGCVRATVIDAFSRNYRVSIVEEATFDRGQASHWINLFDMNQKYDDVVKTDTAVEFLNSLPASLFEGKLPSGPRRERAAIH